MSEREKSKIAEWWGAGPKDSSKNFFRFPPLREYFFECITGRDEPYSEDAIERWTVHTYLKDKMPVDECLSLCCGYGHIERRLANLGVFRHCTGVDLSPGAIAIAKDKAHEAGYDNIDYEVEDLNKAELPPEKYDLVWANGALHHLSGLDRVITQIHTSLKPGGVFVCNEYVGPNHQKLPPHQREIINAVIHLIPEEFRYVSEETYVPVRFRGSVSRRMLYELLRLVTFRVRRSDANSLTPDPRWSKTKIRLFDAYTSFIKAFPERKKRKFRFGKVWDEYSRVVKKNDPSECVRSDEIIPLLKGTFRDVDVRNYNGSILFYALDKKFYEEYERHPARGKALLNFLTHIEKGVIGRGELTSDHAHIIARKEGPRTP